MKNKNSLLKVKLVFRIEKSASRSIALIRHVSLTDSVISVLFKVEWIIYFNAKFTVPINACF